jgi:hypothetical protein
LSVLVDRSGDEDTVRISFGDSGGQRAEVIAGRPGEVAYHLDSQTACGRGRCGDESPPVGAPILQEEQSLDSEPPGEHGVRGALRVVGRDVAKEERRSLGAIDSRLVRLGPRPVMRQPDVAG